MASSICTRPSPVSTKKLFRMMSREISTLAANQLAGNFAGIGTHGNLPAFHATDVPPLNRNRFPGESLNRQPDILVADPFARTAGKGTQYASTAVKFGLQVFIPAA